MEELNIESFQNQSKIEIDYQNPESWYLNDEIKPLIAVSIHSVGPSREQDIASRVLMAGNVSENYSNPIEANRNLNNFLESLNISPGDVVTMHPQDVNDETLNAIDVDAVALDRDRATYLEERGDFIYTRNPERVLSVKPADCSGIICFGQTEQGPIMSLTHLSKHGAERGYLDQMFKHLDGLGVDMGTIKIYIVGGAYKENRPYSNEDNPRKASNYEHLLVDIVDKDISADGKWHYNIDVPGFILNKLREKGINDKQIFLDQTDTARPNSGHSSHSRAVNSGGKELESRDVIVARML